MAKSQHSPRFELIRRHYLSGVWNDAWLKKAVELSYITQAEHDEIVATKADGGE